MPHRRTAVALALALLPCCSGGEMVELTSVQAFESFVDSHERAVLGLFHDCAAACEAFQALSAGQHTSLALAAAYGPLAADVLADVDLELGPGDRALAGSLEEVLLFPGWTDPVLRYNDSWTLAPLLSWVRQIRYPDVHQLSRATHKSLVQESGRAVLWLFADLQAGATADQAFAVAERCVTAHPERLGALYTQGDSPSGRMLQRTVGLDGDAALPTLAIQDAASSGAPPRSFVFPEGMPLDAKEVEAFCADFVSGALERASAETGEAEAGDDEQNASRTSNALRDEL